MTTTLLVGLPLCSACGAVARYLLDRTVAARLARRGARRGAVPPATPSPWGIAAVNALGALLLGLLAGLATRAEMSTSTVTLLGTGFLGSFTTFSTFAVDVVRLWSAGRRRAAVTNGVGTVVVGLALVSAGYLALA